MPFFQSSEEIDMLDRLFAPTKTCALRAADRRWTLARAGVTPSMLTPVDHQQTMSVPSPARIHVRSFIFERERPGGLEGGGVDISTMK
jgi:hypothetical protein